MKEELKESLNALQIASWRKAFLTTPALQTQVHQTLVAKLSIDLEATIAESAVALHPEQLVRLSSDKRSVEMSDRGGTVATCYINAANLGAIHLQFAGRGGSELTDSLRLDCIGEEAYVWTIGSLSIPSADLAAYVLHRLAREATSVVQRETPGTRRSGIDLGRIV